LGKVFFEPLLREARFLRRINRFAALVETPLFGKQQAHVPNSGRLSELLMPEARVWVAEKRAQGRKTGFDLTLVELERGGWACVDARLPGKILENTWEAVKRDATFEGWGIIGREPSYGKGRFDLLLKKGAEQCFVETKSVTLAEKRTALFPDAPTARGRRHMEELAKACREGCRAAVFFIVQRGDAECFAPHDRMDALFVKALRLACRDGVEIYSFLCSVDFAGIALDHSLPLKL